ncbi:MAG: hypothetical protein F6K40_14695 [Okeania sp. SIO3I5]|uniref:hypothetical protein n=1 Tax=Okeania sp. SIO3I5 TaxID=2607805 RepID=UPI0013BA2368|nr:hypothetical protein [Okeania sp. SIO3I5]NEQ37445.1 hypothetical protein [Okeania sp. SIO3I5]
MNQTSIFSFFDIKKAETYTWKGFERFNYWPINESNINNLKEGDIAATRFTFHVGDNRKAERIFYGYYNKAFRD